MPGRLVPHGLGVFELPIVLVAKLSRMRVDHLSTVVDPVLPPIDTTKSHLVRVRSQRPFLVWLTRSPSSCPLEQLFYRQTSLAGHQFSLVIAAPKGPDTSSRSGPARGCTPVSGASARAIACPRHARQKRHAPLGRRRLEVALSGEAREISR